LDKLLSIFPDPNRGKFTIQTETIMNITIINGLGQEVKAFSFSQKENKIRIHALARGLYF